MNPGEELKASYIYSFIKDLTLSPICQEGANQNQKK
jgi:hypothetical protein